MILAKVTGSYWTDGGLATLVIAAIAFVIFLVFNVLRKRRR
jgi:hypothetical protein